MIQSHPSRSLQLFHRVVLPLERLLRRADRKSGCTAAQLSVLAAVRYFGAATLTRIAAHERIALPTASRTVEGLVRTGLLSRLAAPGDRRALRLAVTARGMRAIEIACAAREATLAEAFEDFSAEERAALAILAPALNRVLGLDADVRALMPAVP